MIGGPSALTAFNHAYLAVPMFFCVSGFLFFNNFAFSFAGYLNKVKKRFNTLVIPFFFWNLLNLFLIYISVLLLKGYGTSCRELISLATFQYIINRLFIDMIPYQLWFLRDLMVFCLVSPILYFAVANKKKLLLVVLFLLWFTKIDIFISIEGALFFLTGAYIAINNVSVNRKVAPKYLFTLTTIWLILLLCKTHIASAFPPALIYMHNISIILGIAALWYGYDLLPQRVTFGRIVTQLSAMTFMIYAFHEPVLSRLIKLSYKIAGISVISNILIYLVAPVLVIIISYYIGIFLKKVTPTIYSLATGNR